MVPNQKEAKAIAKQLEIVLDKFTDEVPDKDQMAEIAFELLNAISKAANVIGDKKQFLGNDVIGDKKQFLGNVGFFLAQDKFNESFD